MSSEKRLLLALILTTGSYLAIYTLMSRLGWIPPEPPPVVAAKDDPAKKADLAKKPDAAEPKPGDIVRADPKPEAAVKPPGNPNRPEPAILKDSELVLGSDQDEAPGAYHLRLQLTQHGAAVRSATSARFEAEIVPGRPRPQGRTPRLELISVDPKGKDAPGSLSMILSSPARAKGPETDDAPALPSSVETGLDYETWSVVPEKPGAPAVRAVNWVDPASQKSYEGSEVWFQYESKDPAVIVTKVIRLLKGWDGFFVELRFASPAKDSPSQKLSYRLFGPHGIPIEGEWYTATFRDVFFGQVGGKPDTHSAYDVVKYDRDPSYRVSALPLKYAGVEDQYFATFVQPYPLAKTQEERIDQDAGPILFAKNFENTQKSDVGVEVVSKPFVVAPARGEVVHTYRVFAGPKTIEALTPFEAEDLASYRKNQYFSIPFASTLARDVIAPLLDKIYGLTEAVARLFGGTRGNYGVAIILLTMTVRLIMFPLGRKQAMMAKKMQDLQPVLAAIKEKYKDDKERLTKETMNVWRNNKVNPAAGCIPALIQMPIFVGLWQALNNSVALRHSTFLYIRDLAAPDMLFPFPLEVPFLGSYFNLLPFLVVSLMLVQTKLFSPPPTTPEAEQQQKMMKYMMIFMAFMFYKVPSGLGLYFITSSLWQIGERLLLPKVTAKSAIVNPDDLDENGRGPGGTNGDGTAPKGWFSRRIEKLLEDAAKDQTIRNASTNDDRARAPGRDNGASRERPRNRPRPGKRR